MILKGKKEIRKFSDKGVLRYLIIRFENFTLLNITLWNNKKHYELGLIILNFYEKDYRFFDLNFSNQEHFLFKNEPDVKYFNLILFNKQRLSFRN